MRKFKLRLQRHLHAVEVEEDVEKLVASCRCGARWTGTKPEHCTVCHQTFGSTTAGDKHRYGKPEQRRCRTEEWMTAQGWTKDERDIWRLAPAKSPHYTRKEDDGSQD